MHTAISLRRLWRRRRFGLRLWTLLHAQHLLDGPDAATASTSSPEDDYGRFAARRETQERRSPDGHRSFG